MTGVQTCALPISRERVYPFLPGCVGGRVGVSGAAAWEAAWDPSDLNPRGDGGGDLATWLLGVAQRAAQAA